MQLKVLRIVLRNIEKCINKIIMHKTHESAICSPKFDPTQQIKELKNLNFPLNCLQPAVKLKEMSLNFIRQ